MGRKTGLEPATRRTTIYNLPPFLKGFYGCVLFQYYLTCILYGLLATLPLSTPIKARR